MEFCKLFYLKRCYLFESRAAEFHVCHVYKFERAVRHVVDIFIQELIFQPYVVFSATEIEFSVSTTITVKGFLKSKIIW